MVLGCKQTGAAGGAGIAFDRIIDTVPANEVKRNLACIIEAFDQLADDFFNRRHLHALKIKGGSQPRRIPTGINCMGQ